RGAFPRQEAAQRIAEPAGLVAIQRIAGNATPANLVQQDDILQHGANSPISIAAPVALALQMKCLHGWFCRSAFFPRGALLKTPLSLFFPMQSWRLPRMGKFLSGTRFDGVGVR